MRTKKPKKCSVVGCNSVFDPLNPGEKFFRFPRRNTTEKAKKWLAFAQNPKLMNKKTLIQALICARHFACDMFMDDTQTRLGFKAVPTLYPAEGGTSLISNSHDEECLSYTSRSNSPLTPPLPLSPSPPTTPIDPECLDGLMVEVLDEEQAEARIYRLMKKVDLVVKENINIKKENTRLRLENDYLKEEISTWQRCTHALVKKASKNSCLDFLNFKKENDSLRSKLASAMAELGELKRRKSLEEQEVTILTSMQVSDDGGEPTPGVARSGAGVTQRYMASEEVTDVTAEIEGDYDDGDDDYIEPREQSIEEMIKSGAQSDLRPRSGTDELELPCQMDDIIVDWAINNEVVLQSDDEGLSVSHICT